MKEDLKSSKINAKDSLMEIYRNYMQLAHGFLELVDTPKTFNFNDKVHYIYKFYNQKTYYYHTYITSGELKLQLPRDYMLQYVNSSIASAILSDPAAMQDLNNVLLRNSGVSPNKHIFAGFANALCLASFKMSLDSGNCGAVLLKDLSCSDYDEIKEACLITIEDLSRRAGKPLIIATDKLNGMISKLISHERFNKIFSAYNIGSAVVNPNSGNSIFSISFVAKSIREPIQVESILF